MKFSLPSGGGGKTCDVDIWAFVYISCYPPAHLIIRRLYVTVYIPVMPLALSVLMCCVVRPLFTGIWCFILCIYVLVLYRSLCFTSGL